MTGVEPFESCRQPAPLGRIQRRYRSVEVAPVLWASGLRLEQQRAVWPQIGNAIGRDAYHRRSRGPQARISPVDPRLVVTGLSHNVDTPSVRLHVEHPMLMPIRWRLLGGLQTADLTPTGDVERELTQVPTNRCEVASRNSDLQVLVRARLLPKGQIDRPSADDTPGNVEAVKPISDLPRSPGFPGVDRRAVPSGDGQFADGPIEPLLPIWLCQIGGDEDISPITIGEIRLFVEHLEIAVACENDSGVDPLGDPSFELAHHAGQTLGDVVLLSRAEQPGGKFSDPLGRETHTRSVPLDHSQSGTRSARRNLCRRPTQRRSGAAGRRSRPRHRSVVRTLGAGRVGLAPRAVVVDDLESTPPTPIHGAASHLRCPTHRRVAASSSSLPRSAAGTIEPLDAGKPGWRKVWDSNPW